MTTFNVLSGRGDNAILNADPVYFIKNNLNELSLTAIAEESQGEMYEYTVAPGTTITVTTAGTFYGWISAVTGTVTGGNFITFLSNATADRLVVGSDGPGIYHLYVSCSFSGSINAVIEGALFLNDVLQDNLRFTRKLSAAGDVGCVSISGILTLADTDYIDFRVTSDTNADVVNIINCNVLISRG